MDEASFSQFCNGKKFIFAERVEKTGSETIFRHGIPNSQQMCLKYHACAQNLASGNSPADPPDPADLPETGPAEQNRPSIPRAGVQDDGSLP